MPEGTEVVGSRLHETTGDVKYHTVVVAAAVVADVVAVVVAVVVVTVVQAGTRDQTVC